MKALLAVLLTLTLLVSLTACGEKAANADTSTAGSDTRNSLSATSSTTTTTLSSSAETTTTNKALTPEEAREIALSDANVSFDDAYDVWVDFDRDDGVPYYEVDFKANGTKYDYEIHAEDGRILQVERDPLPNTTTDTTTHITSGTIYNQSDPILTYEEATAIALTHAEVKKADAYDLSVEFDREHGTATYEIDFEAGGQEYEYIVHAENGEILYSDKHPAD